MQPPTHFGSRDKTMYAERRQQLLNRLPTDSLAILAGYPQRVRSKNIKYHFRQDNDFLYLTGFNEPDALALMWREDHEDKLVLFCRPRDPAAEVSFGRRSGPEGAIEHFGADEAYAIADFDEVLLQKLAGKCDIFLGDELGRLNDKLWPLLNRQRHTSPFDAIKSYPILTPLAKVLHPLRVIKTDHELGLIRHAVKASVEGHKALLRKVRPGLNEAQLAAHFMATIADNQCLDVAYPNIVAGGNNACCLHYEDNCCELKDGELLLVDAGAEYHHYCADITRTFPINGRFAPAQRQIHDLVLKALDAAIALVRPGLPWDSLYQTCMRVLAEGLIELGLLTGSIDEVMHSESYHRFTVHKTGHWLGMDVHDVGPYHDSEGKWRTLEAGMVFTLEPGLYFPADAEDIPAKYRGIGVRIEDDILVTEDGHENLSRGAPRSAAEIEAFMAQAD
ncbi:aminopeptidase P N-terminal domain-containing protein [Shewanella cyperi]|uniref:aminopeptidase P N-terminal domain-containing protein n=1 Tax=Shewanella cyperi TaxID=2814292 RepID=UPI001A9540D3|nr:aminopeptidase P N-terminal domain-containing protein [Shewanella cyperi]QSX39487.1 aminopeptidase P N-terminal domain-containing protein [Shewanella cyperi]